MSTLAATPPATAPATPPATAPATPSATPPATPPFLLRFALPEIYNPTFEGTRALVVLRILLLTAPVLLLLDWPGWGRTWVLPLAGVGYALVLIAYARSVGQLGGFNPFDLPDRPAARPYYIVALAAAAVLALSPFLHFLDIDAWTRVTIGLASALGLLVVLFLARKISRPGIAGHVFERGPIPSPVDVAQKLENLI